MKRYEFDGAPLILALVLGPMFENSPAKVAHALGWESDDLFLTAPFSSFLADRNSVL